MVSPDNTPHSSDHLSEELKSSSFLIEVNEDRVVDLETESLRVNLVSEPVYTVEDVTTVRNALKLTSKLLRDVEHGWGVDEALPLAAHAAETGMLLTLAGASANQIAAGMLYDAYEFAIPGFWPEYDKIVEHKFGKEVVDLIHFPDPVELTAAMTLADLSKDNTDIPRNVLEEISEGCRAVGTPSILLEQLNLESSGVLQSERPDTVVYTAADVVEIRNAIRAATLLFKDVERKWGPEETLPMVSHAAEVGILLAMARGDKDLIAAGLLHDFLEGYTEHDPEMIREFIETRFNQDVLKLIEGVTEPPKSTESDNWFFRKMAILDQVEESTGDVAMLSCATKISTLSSGNKMLRSGEPISKWSAGGIKENAAFFRIHLMQYQHRLVPEVLTQVFERELLELESYINEHPD